MIASSVAIMKPDSMIATRPAILMNVRDLRVNVQQTRPDRSVRTAPCLPQGERTWHFVLDLASPQLFSVFTERSLGTGWAATWPT